MVVWVFMYTPMYIHIYIYIWQCVKTNSTPVVHIKIAGIHGCSSHSKWYENRYWSIALYVLAIFPPLPAIFHVLPWDIEFGAQEFPKQSLRGRHELLHRDAMLRPGKRKIRRGALEVTNGYIYMGKLKIKFTNLNGSAIWGWFPILTIIPVRSQWGRYNLPIYIYICIYIYVTYKTKIIGGPNIVPTYGVMENSSSHWLGTLITLGSNFGIS